MHYKWLFFLESIAKNFQYLHDVFFQDFQLNVEMILMSFINGTKEALIWLIK